MSRKITLRFVGYFFIFYVSIAAVSLCILFFLAVRGLSDFNAYANIREADKDTIKSHVKEDEQGVFSFSQELIESATESGGILQLIDKDGHLLASSSRNDDLSNSYSFADFVHLSADKKAFLWSLDHGRSLLFQEWTESDVLMHALMNEPGFPEITSEKQKKLLERNHAHFELYTENGDRVFRLDHDTEEAVSGMELLEMSRNFEEQRELQTARVLADGTTAVVRMPNAYYAPFDTTMMHVVKMLFVGLAAFHGVLLMVILLFSFFIGRRFGRPVFYFLNKIEKLSKKDYSSMEERGLRNKKDGRLKKKYRIYEEVDVSLNELSNTLEENERLVEKTKQLREDWISGLSHDLKTPLTSILGYAQMLESSYEWTPSEVLKFAAIMREKAVYMDTLINDLTYTYQLKNDGLMLDREKTDLVSFLHQYDKNVEADLIRFPASRPPIYVDIDPARFNRVLDNIISNAVKHNPEGTPIYADIQQDQNFAVLQVRDEGIGISPEVMQNLFDRYYRGTNTTASTEGTGLGMAIAKQLVEAHDGKITVTSDGTGTIIRIWLPLAV